MDTPRKTRPLARQGFSLIELMIVLIIIAILAGVVGLALGGVVGNARRTQTEAHMNSVSQALILYRSKYSVLPQSGDLGLQDVVNDGLLQPGAIIDGWDRPMDYVPAEPATGFLFFIYSPGEDGSWDTLQDNITWTDQGKYEEPAN